MEGDGREKREANFFFFPKPSCELIKAAGAEASAELVFTSGGAGIASNYFAKFRRV